MNYLDELKEFVVLHARAQKIPSGIVRTVLSRVQHDGTGPNSWVAEWVAAATAASARGDHRLASRLFGLARFPFVDGSARETALTECVAEFAAATRKRPGISVAALRVGSASVRYYLAGAGSADVRRPLLVVIGGIVSLKEQWGEFLGLCRRLNAVVAVTEMPGVGENGMRYTPDSAAMLSALLDELAPVADVDNTFIVGFSFGGHLALQCAASDPRVRGVATVGAPLRTFFTDPEQWARTPQTTRRTLARLTNTAEAELPAMLMYWALTAEQLAALDIPVYYVASARDEIIPAAERALLLRCVRNAQVITFDDVHGSPGHLAQLRAWIGLALFSWRGIRGMQPLVLSAILRIANTGELRHRTIWKRERMKVDR
jgi:esterase FrsA